MKKPDNPKLGTAYKLTKINCLYEIGTTVYLIHDDHSSCPWFSSDKNTDKYGQNTVAGRDYTHIHWSHLEPLDYPPLKEAKYKIRVNPEQSRQIQEICFKAGIYWSHSPGESVVSHTTKDHGWLYIENKHIRGWDLSTRKTWGSAYDKLIEISAQDFIRIYGAKREFRVGDVVKTCFGIGEIVFIISYSFAVKVYGWGGGHGCDSERTNGCPDTGESGWFFTADDLELITPVEEKEPETDCMSGRTYTTADLAEMYRRTRDLCEPRHVRPVYLGWDFVIKTTGKQPKKGIMDTLRSIPKKLQRLMDKGMQARFQLGRLNDRLELTSEGQSDLMDYLADLHADELGKRAIADLKEVKKARKESEEE